MICGVDEAGKGAVLGPMVIAAVACPDKEACEGLSFRDSKALSPRVREKLFAVIMERFSVSTLELSARTIDERRQRASMNLILALAHAHVIDALRPDIAYVDAGDVNADRYGRMVHANLTCGCRVISRHKADVLYPHVSAASIVAKVCRDRAIEELAAEYGHIGSGYPSDADTVSFLVRYLEEFGTPPSCSRLSWKTIEGLIAERQQSFLFDF